VVKQILVYGSLRKNFPLHRNMVEGGAQFIGEARLPGFDLHAVTWYPGIVKNPSNTEGVVGELYTIPNENFIKTLDLVEGYSERDPERSLFRREEVEIEGEPTYVYTYNCPLRGAPKVASGDWKDKPV
jgi:gamma-glutamylcyclotransferase (GGCT)/AIG2-like uncharacterized protein YtfP